MSDSFTSFGQPTGTAAGTVATGNDSRFATTPLIPTDIGYLAWTFPPMAGQGLTALPTSGMLQLTRLHRVPAATISNIVVQVTTAGSALTAGQCFAVLYSSAGAKLAITADQATAWASSGQKAMALTVPYVNAATAAMYVGLWFVGTTGPTLLRSNNIAATVANGTLTAPNLAYASANTGLTTTAPDPFGTQTATTLPWWVALS